MPATPEDMFNFGLPGTSPPERLGTGNVPKPNLESQFQDNLIETFRIALDTIFSVEGQLSAIGEVVQRIIDNPALYIGALATVVAASFIPVVGQIGALVLGGLAIATLGRAAFDLFQAIRQLIEEVEAVTDRLNGICFVNDPDGQRRARFTRAQLEPIGERLGRALIGVEASVFESILLGGAGTAAARISRLRRADGQNLSETRDDIRRLGAVPDNGPGSVANANFAQSQIRRDETFSEDGQEIFTRIAGRPINNVDDLADAIRRGDIDVNQVPVNFVDLNGQRLILNSRTSVALDRAGVSQADFFGVNKTGVEAFRDTNGRSITFDDLARDQLRRNNLPPTGSPNIPRGGR